MRLQIYRKVIRIHANIDRVLEEHFGRHEISSFWLRRCIDSIYHKESFASIENHVKNYAARLNCSTEPGQVKGLTYAYDTVSQIAALFHEEELVSYLTGKIRSMGIPYVRTIRVFESDTGIVPIRVHQ